MSWRRPTILVRSIFVDKREGLLLYPNREYTAGVVAGQLYSRVLHSRQHRPLSNALLQTQLRSFRTRAAAPSNELACHW